MVLLVWHGRNRKRSPILTNWPGDRGSPLQWLTYHGATQRTTKRPLPRRLQFGPRPCPANSIRRAEISDRSGGFGSQKQPTKTYRPAPCRTTRVIDNPHSNSIRRAETSDWSGDSARLPSSKIHQARVCPPGLPAKTPLFHVKQGRSVIGSMRITRPASA